MRGGSLGQAALARLRRFESGIDFDTLRSMKARSRFPRLLPDSNGMCERYTLRTRGKAKPPGVRVPASQLPLLDTTSLRVGTCARNTRNQERAKWRCSNRVSCRRGAQRILASLTLATKLNGVCPYVCVTAQTRQTGKSIKGAIRQEEVPQMYPLSPGHWYLMYTCKGCQKRQILFPDLSDGKSQIHATYIVGCLHCGQEGSYDSEVIERYQHVAEAKWAVSESSPKARILCTEDDAETRDMLSLVLSQEGYEVICSGSSEEALRLAEVERFDLVLVDSGMPGMSGAELTGKVREFNIKTPILFYTGAAYQKDKDNAREAGAQGYLVKPVPNDDIIAEVAKLIAEARIAYPVDILIP